VLLDVVVVVIAAVVGAVGNVVTARIGRNDHADAFRYSNVVG
jgi:hypothetical protein